MDATKYHIREMQICDHAQLIVLWSSMEGLSVDASDSRENLARYLDRNPKLSYIAEVDGQIIATIKCAQDGRRGYIHHMAVLPEYRALGIAKALYTKSIEELQKQGIGKCNLYVLDSNPKALAFWKHNGWSPLERNFDTLQKDLTP